VGRSLKRAEKKQNGKSNLPCAGSEAGYTCKNLTLHISLATEWIINDNGKLMTSRVVNNAFDGCQEN